MGTKSELCLVCKLAHENATNDPYANNNNEACIRALAEKLQQIEERTQKIGSVAHEAAMWTRRY